MPRVVPSIPSRWVCHPCFVSEESELYSEYAALLLRYNHWRPEDVKKMSPRERRYWMKLSNWVEERKQLAAN